MAKVYIDGEIGYDWWTDEGITAKSFMRDFDIAKAASKEKGEELEVYINSPGGSLFEGVAICNHMLASDYPVTTINMGVAISMAFMALQCGTTRKAYKATTMLAHACNGRASGTVTDLKNAIGLMEALNSNMVDIVAAKSGKTSEEIKDLYFDDKDHSLTATEALEAGLLDQVIDIAAENVPTGSIEEILASFRKEPKAEKSFLAKITDAITASLSQGAVNPQSSIPTEMKIQDKLDLLVSAEASAEDKAAAMKAIKDGFDAEEVFAQADIDTAVTAAVTKAEETKDEAITALEAKIVLLEKKPAAAATPPAGGEGDGSEGKKKYDTLEEQFTSNYGNILKQN
jgi:ATP-dependent Clp endopeptidase proteolytic subunit ClpP